MDYRCREKNRLSKIIFFVLVKILVGKLPVVLYFDKQNAITRRTFAVFRPEIHLVHFSNLLEDSLSLALTPLLQYYEACKGSHGNNRCYCKLWFGETIPRHIR
jgi:hypothetical protein